MAAVAVNPLHETHTLGMFSSLFSECLLTEDALAVMRRIVAAIYTHDPPTIHNIARHTPIMAVCTCSMASSGMEDWDLRDAHDTNHYHTSTTAEQTENWDDDFKVETRNNSPRKSRLSTPRRRDVRETRRVGSRVWARGTRKKDRTVTARSRRTVLSRFGSANPLPPLPMPLFPTNNQGPSPDPFPHSPTASVFSVPNTIHTYSSFVHSSHPRPMSLGSLLPLPPIHNERGGG